MRQLFSNKLFMALTLSDLISNFGDSLFYLVMMRYVLDIPQTTLAMSVITLAEMVPMITNMVSGDRADQTDNKLRAILVTQFLRAVLYLGVFHMMSFPVAFWVAMAVSAINLVSDLAGQYESALFIPISLRVLSKEEREGANSFRQALFSGSRMIFLTSGSLFLTIFTYRQIALINAGTFFMSALIMIRILPGLRQLLIDNPLPAPQKSQAEGSSFFKRVKASFEEFRSLPNLMNLLLIIALINGILSGLNNFLVITMKEKEGFVIGSATQTLALFPILLMAGQMLGSILAMNLFKKLSLYQEILWASFAGVLIYAFLLMGSIYGTFASIFLISLASGAIGPKFYAYIMNHVNEERIALTMTSLQTVVTSGIVVIGSLTAVLMNILPLFYLLVTFLLAMVALTGYVARSMRNVNW